MQRGRTPGAKDSRARSETLSGMKETADPHGAQLRARAVIDLAAVRANVRTLRERAPRAALMAVVKADGYGHGAAPCARAAVEAGATWLGAATPQERSR